LPAPLDPRLRPYRIAVYGAFLLLTAVFIGSVIRSIWVDLYAPPASTAASPTLAACRDELATLARKFSAYGEASLVPGAKSGADGFAADADRQLDAFQRRCLDSLPAGASREDRRQLGVAADRLDGLLPQLARFDD
jgi:hypothetical protein